jgi:hypothetical protein
LTIRSIILVLFFALKINAQTKVYAVTPEGLADKNRFAVFKYGKFAICDNCKESFNDSAAFEEFHTVVFFEDRIIVQLEKPKEPLNTHVVFGKFTDEKKVLVAKIEKKGDLLRTSFDPTAEELNSAPYIYDKKIFDSNGNVIAFIEGEENMVQPGIF